MLLITMLHTSLPPNHQQMINQPAPSAKGQCAQSLHSQPLGDVQQHRLSGDGSQVDDQLMVNDCFTCLGIVVYDGRLTAVDAGGQGLIDGIFLWLIAS